MKAINMTAAGGPEVLKYQEVPDPQIRSGTELLIKIKAAGVNPVDAKQRGRGTWYPGNLPAILGIDGAGIVKERGKDARQFNIGDEVYFAHGGIGKQPGNYAEYSVVEERFAARKPRSVSFAEAAAAPSSCITAWETLFYHGRLQKNQKVLIHAGAGGVGHIAVQLARVNGAKICTTVSSEEKARFVRELGAEKVIMYQEKDFVKETLEWTEGEGVDLVVDLVGKDTFFRTFTATCCYGNIIALLGPDPDYADWKEARLRNLQISYYLMLTPIYYELLDHQFRQTTILQRCSQLLEENELKIHVTKTFPLKEAKEAHHTIEKGDTMGKIVLIPDS